MQKMVPAIMATNSGAVPEISSPATRKVTAANSIPAVILNGLFMPTLP
jgi:hypothetical protein